MVRGNEERRDPLAGLGGGEPVEELGLTKMPVALTRRPSRSERKSPVRPSERRRARRKIGVTFSDEGIPERLRALALRWGMMAPDGRSANVSALVEYLLIPRLAAAEKEELGPPGEGW
ncbi:MAG: hypothetical protein SWK90_14260 [Chloroflexota bacterium]|nr:hypothetical protein [Chloroflexota bacterium]